MSDKSLAIRERIEIDLRKNGKINVHDLGKAFPDGEKQFHEEIRPRMLMVGIFFKPAWMLPGGRPGDYVLGGPKDVVRKADNARRRVPRLARFAAKLLKYLQNNPDLSEADRMSLQVAEKKIRDGLTMIDEVFYKQRPRIREE